MVMVRVGVRIRVREEAIRWRGLCVGIGIGFIVPSGPIEPHLVRVRVRVSGGGSNVQRDRPQNVMTEANSDVPFHCDASFSMPPSIEM